MEIKRHEPQQILCEAVEYGNLVFLAGAVAEDTSKGVKAQTEDVLRKIDRLLGECGSGKSKILSATIYLADIRTRAQMNEAWSAWVDTGNLPARACVEAKMADPGMLVEIQVTAGK